MGLTFGAWLKQRRRALDLTQDDLAKRAFCSVTAIRKIEAGDLTPSRELAQALARALALPERAHAEFIRLARTRDAMVTAGAFDLSAPDAATTGHATAFAPQTKPRTKFLPPAPLTNAIGREHDTSVVTRLVQMPGVRLVTLTGAPGTGKTRLSLEVAAELAGEAGRAEFEDGVAFVALAPVTQPARVAEAMVKALRIQFPASALPAAALREFLRDKRLLLVLDNFEHLLSEDSEAVTLVRDVLRDAPHLKILVTSREPLRVYGERELPVAPLAVPPLAPLPPLRELENYGAVQLFIERAQRVKPGWQLTAVNAAAIARLCAGLDGLPLAIEMAAARLKWDSPQALLAQWDQRLQLLEQRTRDRDARQQTMRGALDWSYARLDETERRVLRQLGIFRGGFTADAAQAVCQLSDPSPLENLVEKSLVTRQHAPSLPQAIGVLTRQMKQERAQDGAPRYALLEIIREYAREKLLQSGGAALSDGAPGASEIEACAARHYDYFVKLAEQVQVHTNAQAQITWGERLEVEHDNLRAALDWALEQPDANLALRLTGALHFFWMDRSHAREAQAWYELALARSDDACEPLYLAKAYSGAGSMAWMHGDPVQATAFHEQALHYFEQCDDKNGIALSLQNLAAQAVLQDDFERVERLTLNALDVARECNNTWVTSRALNGLGMIANSRCENDKAAMYYGQALALAQQDHDEVLSGYALHNLGCVESRRGNFARASSYLAESARVGEAIRHEYMIAANLVEEGLLFLRWGKLDEAVLVCRKGARLTYESSLQDLFASGIEWLAAAFAYQ